MIYALISSRVKSNPNLSTITSLSGYGGYRERNTMPLQFNMEDKKAPFIENRAIVNLPHFGIRSRAFIYEKPSIAHK